MKHVKTMDNQQWEALEYQACNIFIINARVALRKKTDSHASAQKD